MKYFMNCVIILIFLAICSCAAKEGLKDNSLNYELKDKTENVIDSSQNKSDEINDKYVNSEDTESSGNLQNYGNDDDEFTEEHIGPEAWNRIVIALNSICSEMDQKRWDNININHGYSDELPFLGIYVTEEDEKLELYTIKGEVNTYIYLIIIVGFSDEFPDGKIVSTTYVGEGGREWHYEECGFEENEIIDAYDQELWLTMWSY